jgi:hypothetical protein
MTTLEIGEFCTSLIAKRNSKSDGLVNEACCWMRRQGFTALACLDADASL